MNRRLDKGPDCYVMPPATRAFIRPENKRARRPAEWLKNYQHAEHAVINQENYRGLIT